MLDKKYTRKDRNRNVLIHFKREKSFKMVQTSMETYNAIIRIVELITTGRMRRVREMSKNDITKSYK